MALIKFMPGQKWPGFSFALYPLRVQGFYFALLKCSPIQAFTARFVPSMQLYRPHRKTAHRALQAFFRPFAVFCRCCMAGASDYTTPPAPRWSTSRHRNASSAYQIPPPRRTLYSSTQTAYYNNVYKGATVRPCYGSMPDGAAYRRPCQPGGVCSYRGGSLASAAPGGAVQQQERDGRRGTIGGSRRSSFRAVAR